MPPTEIVITGLGVVSPLGIGRTAFWEALSAGRSGIGPITQIDSSGLTVHIAGEVKDFEPKRFITNRKGLKLMSRDAQLGIAASVLACQEAGIAAGVVDPERFGVVLGADRICGSVYESEEPYRRSVVDGHFDIRRWGTHAMPASFPLSFLRVLPNMITSHISIAHDARGPNNTIHHTEVSSLLAVSEAVRVIERGWADVMLAGGASSQMNPFDWARFCKTGVLSLRQDDPSRILRPFDRDRDGKVIGEGAAVFVLESRRHAESRGAVVLGRILGFCSTHEPPTHNRSSESLQHAIRGALDRAGMQPADVGHVNAHGVSTVDDDRIEAASLRAAVGDVPVTAPKSYFGDLGAAGGAMEAAVSVLALDAGQVPPTLNYEHPDPECPVEVIHGRPLASAQPVALLVNNTPIGQAAAVVIAAAS